jgi:outer membrane biosynthesis protein TonB
MVVASALLHAGLLGLVFVSPHLHEREPPRVISVELISPPGAPAAAAKPAPAPAPEPAPAPVPEAAPPPPPPPKPKQIVLPEKPTAPKPPDKAKPKPREKEVFKEPPKKKPEKDLDELLAEMRNSDTTKPAATPAPGPPAEAPVDTATATAGGPSEGAAISPEEAAWRARVKLAMKGIWVLAPGFRAQTLQTIVVVSLDGAGTIVGEPRITKKSGNPWFDESVIRALGKVSKLPQPPQAGDWPLQFEPGDSL